MEATKQLCGLWPATASVGTALHYDNACHTRHLRAPPASLCQLMQVLHLIFRQVLLRLTFAPHVFPIRQEDVVFCFGSHGIHVHEIHVVQTLSMFCLCHSLV
eukprot:TRINITY_DN30436_c0_g1_i1.p1 TRINITY_DN30436_c0_g1~~TRINITY_DN30436_c0_g1_i1.p1  ORF type:complete len:102 (+),score=8.83 TRINITY_DN30436_c0_g1_i1:2-307(+)